MTRIVVVIDVDGLERQMLAQSLRDAGYEVIETGVVIEGLVEIAKRKPDAALLAEDPSRAIGVLLLAMRRLTNAPIMIVGSGDDSEEVRLLGMGADFYLRRPVNTRVALARFRALMRRWFDL